MQSKLLLAAAAATSAIAFEMSSTLPRILHRAGNDALEARDKTACASVWMAHSTIVDDFPTEPTALATETNLDIPQITDPCVFPSITGQAGQIITSYSSALQSWQDAHITEIRDIYSACSDVPEVASALDAYGSAICSTALAVLTSGDATATATGSGSAATATSTASGSASASATASRSGSSASASGASASGSAASTTAAAAAAAPRETGLFVAAAAAAAGIVGAIVL
ncbi:hypothetical protein CSPX01_10803 [Colletotrichum filicis]|nr:hypothetical protein CSPX01_10803 [Colletotrichum filicis]